VLSFVVDLRIPVDIRAGFEIAGEISPIGRSSP
jgi:hypothetical protein